MVDFLVRQIPLPIARPQIEDIVVDTRIYNRDIPVPDIFSYSQSWIDWITERVEEMKEMINQLNTGYLDNNYTYSGHDIWPFLGIIGFLVVIGYLTAWVFKK